MTVLQDLTPRVIDARLEEPETQFAEEFRGEPADRDRCLASIPRVSWINCN